MRAARQTESRSLRAVALAAVVAVSLGTATPAGAHYQASVSHLWSHLRTYTDARYQQKSALKTLRGTYVLYLNAKAPGDGTVQVLTFAPQLPAPPTVHIVNVGQTPPAECPGTVASPQAAPGHLCLYESYAVNRDGINFFDPTTFTPNAVAAFGGSIGVSCTAVGVCESLGSWAVTRP